MCGGYQSQYKDDCYHLNLTTKTWDLNRTIMTDYRYLASSVVHHGEMVVLGGLLSDTVDLYRNGTWKRMDHWRMPKANHASCAVAYKKYIYQIGGYGLDDGGVLRLNTETASYQDVPSLPSGERSYHMCLLTTINGEYGILVTGGYQAINGKNVELLNSTNRLLTTIKEKDEILVSGSYRSSSRNVEFLNLANHQWTQLGSLRQARHKHGLEMINGKPTVFGGYSYDDGVALDGFEYYDEDKNAWHTSLNMKLTKPKIEFASVRVNVEIINK